MFLRYPGDSKRCTSGALKMFYFIWACCTLTQFQFIHRVLSTVFMCYFSYTYDAYCWTTCCFSGCSVYGITYTKIPNARFFPPLSFQPAMGTTSPVTPAFFTRKCTGRTDFNCIAVSFEPRGDGGYGAFHEDGVFLDPDNKPYITYSRTFSIYIRNCL